MTIVARTRSESIFALLRDHIITGRSSCGTPLRPAVLAVELGVAPDSLRQALARLEQQRLLIACYTDGYVVRPPSSLEMRELYALRRTLEPAAAAHAATQSDEAGRAAAHDAFARLDADRQLSPCDAAVRNRAFHVALVRPGRQLITIQVIENLSVMADRYAIAHLKHAGRNARVYTERAALLDAFMARDGVALEQLLTRHIQTMLDELTVDLKVPSEP